MGSRVGKTQHFCCVLMTNGLKKGTVEAIKKQLGLK
jgi:hypothetical protein